MNQPLPFTPVPLKARHDGWTPARQHEFIMRLADTGSVQAACDRVGMSVQAAYRLRRHPDAVDLRDAWERALEQAATQLEQVALERALHGEFEVVERNGVELRSRRKPCSDRLLIYMLERQERARRRRSWAARASFPDPRNLEDAELTGLAMTAEAFPDRPGAEGEEFDLWDLRQVHHAPQMITPHAVAPRAAAPHPAAPGPDAPRPATHAIAAPHAATHRMQTPAPAGSGTGSGGETEIFLSVGD